MPKPEDTQTKDKLDKALENNQDPNQDSNTGNNKDDPNAKPSDNGNPPPGDKDKDTNLQPEPDDNKIRSELGRKVKSLEESFTSLNSKLDFLIDRQPDHSQQDNSPEDDNEEFFPNTKKEFNEAVDKRVTEIQSQEKKAIENYNDTYIKAIEDFRDNTGEDYEAICDELSKNFNFRHSNNAKMDARLNFLEASNAYYRKKSTTKENPLHGKDNDLPLGTGGGDRHIDNHEDNVPKLDDYAADYMRKTGMSEDSVKNAMKRELPPSLKGVV